MIREEKEQTGKYVLQMARLLEDGCYQQEMLLKAVHIIDEALEQEPCDYKALYENYLKKSEIVIEQLRADRDRLLEDIEKIRAEILQLKTKTSYTFVNIDDVLRLIDKYKAESEET